MEYRWKCHEHFFPAFLNMAKHQDTRIVKKLKSILSIREKSNRVQFRNQLFSVPMKQRTGGEKKDIHWTWTVLYRYIYMLVREFIRKYKWRKILYWGWETSWMNVSLERWCHHRLQLAVGLRVCAWTQHRPFQHRGVSSCGYWSPVQLPWCLRTVLHRSLQ